MSKYVIVGASAGGIGAVEAIRAVDPVGTIAVISDETFPQYSRPMISDFLSGEADLQKMKYRGEEFWEKNDVQILAGRSALCLNLSDKYVELDGGERIGFENLLLATGGKPFIPKIEGAEKEGVFTFTRMPDIEHLSAEVKKDGRAVVIGGGLIGISAAEALQKCGLKVTIVELKDKILSLILDAAAAEIIEDAVKKAGVTVITGQTVQRILGKAEDNNVVGGVILTNGDQMPCDLVVIAIGVIPRTELVAGTAVKVNRGIVVDRMMRTNIPNVYACGDVAEAYDFVLDENRLLALWPVAHLGGRVAGYNMAGMKMGYVGGTAMSALKYFDVPVISVGMVNPREEKGYEVLVNRDPAKNVYRKVVLRNNVIVGMIFVNQIERAGTVFHLLKNHVNVKAFKKRLVSEEFSLASLPSSLRQKMFLGGLR